MNKVDGSMVPLVSVCCITYNQALYIKDALDSFLMQKTNFPFEIIIHDDASTDDTVLIIEEYQRKYPNIINLIKQDENQYRKGIKISKEFVWPNARGEFIAICEGDDYWIDDCKLQKQVDALSNCKAVDLCFGYGFKKYKRGKLKRFNYYGGKRKIIELRDLIVKGGGAMPTASIMFRKPVLKKIPEWFDFAPVGDFYLQCFASTNGALYLPDAFCVYRVQAQNSWSSSFDSIKVDYLNKSILSLSKLDEFYMFKYKKEVSNLKARAYYFVGSSFLRTGDYSSAKKYFKVAVHEAKIAPFAYWFKLFISCSPFFVSIYKSIYFRFFLKS